MCVLLLYVQDKYMYMYVACETNSSVLLFAESSQLYGLHDPIQLL